MPNDTHSSKRPVITSHIHGSLRLTAEQSVIPHEYPPATTLTNQEPPKSNCHKPTHLLHRPLHLIPVIRTLIPVILPSHSFRPSFLPFSHHFFFPFAMPSYQSLASLFKRLIELAVISHRRKSPFFTFRSLFFPAGDNALDPFPVIPATRHLFQFQSLLFASIYYSSLASTPFFPSTSKCS